MKNLFNDILLLYYLYRHELVVTIKCQIKLHYMCFQNLNPSKPIIFNIRLWKVHSSLYVTWWLKPGTKGCHQVFPIVYIVQCNTGGRSRISGLRSGSLLPNISYIYIGQMLLFLGGRNTREVQTSNLWATVLGCALVFHEIHNKMYCSMSGA